MYKLNNKKRKKSSYKKKILKEKPICEKKILKKDIKNESLLKRKIYSRKYRYGLRKSFENLENCVTLSCVLKNKRKTYFNIIKMAIEYIKTLEEALINSWE